MLSNVSQYSPQGLLPQFAGLQGVAPQMNPGVFGPPGAIGGGNVFGHDSGQSGLSQPYPFGAQMNPYLQNPFAQSPFGPSPFAVNPYLQNPSGHAGGPNPVQHLVPVLAQLAQQIAAQSALTQQIGIALHQLAQQLVAQSGGQYPQSGGQYPGQNPFAGVTQGGYGGFNSQAFNPQTQGWGANRPQTIQ
jgi:hypothetical protein